MIYEDGLAVQTLQLRGVDVQFIGDPAILEQPLLGLFCSQKCPGKLIIEAFDLAKELRDQRVPVISGFHSSIEKEMLHIFMRGTQPIVICLAREMKGYSIPIEYKTLLNEGRLLLISPFFGKKFTRITKNAAVVRNQIVGLFSTLILLVHAEPGGSIDQLSQKWVVDNKEVFGLQGSTNQYLFERGVKVWEINTWVSHNR